MEHFYQGIPGYFSFPDFYSWLARRYGASGARGVEVGSFAGRSAAYLAVELENFRNEYVASTGDWEDSKPCSFDLVDMFDAPGIGGADAVRERLASVSHIASVCPGDSAGSAARYEDLSLDWVYIDADHRYEAVRRDILAWLPKVKKGGVIAGHDYAAYPTFGVIEAVTEVFPRVEVWRGEIFNGDGVRDFSHDAAWLGRYYPTWCARI